MSAKKLPVAVAKMRADLKRMRAIGIQKWVQDCPRGFRRLDPWNEGDWFKISAMAESGEDPMDVFAPTN